MPKATALKQLIVASGRVQADVALEAGISESRMSRIANGRVRARDYERRQIARVLGVDPTDLATGELGENTPNQVR